jgi:hypothetical protein
MVQGGHTQRRGARGVVESVKERLEWVVHCGSASVAVEWGGAVVRGWRGCRGQS